MPADPRFVRAARLGVRRTRTTAPVAVLGSVLLLSGCGDDAVQVDPPSPPDEAATSCRKLVRALPATLAGEQHRATAPRSRYTAAWGDPPVVLRCGVGEPAGLGPTSQLFSVNGVDWFPVEEDDGSYTFTTTGRVADVEVSVPAEHQPGAAFLTDLAKPVDRLVAKQPG